MTVNPKVYFIGAGPGDPDLLTLKGRRLLDEAQRIVYTGSLINPQILENVKGECINSASLTLEEIIETLTTSAREGKLTVRLHTGDTSFYSAISEQIEELAGRGISVEVVPGVTAAAAAAAALCQELTIPRVSQTVIITRMEGRTPVPEKERLRELASHQATLVIYLSIALIDQVQEELLIHYSPETPVVVVEKASWPQERIIRGTLADINKKVKDAEVVKTALILVGEALRSSLPLTGELAGERRDRKSLLYDTHFTHTYRNEE